MRLFCIFKRQEDDRLLEKILSHCTRTLLVSRILQRKRINLRRRSRDCFDALPRQENLCSRFFRRVPPVQEFVKNERRPAGYEEKESSRESRVRKDKT